MNLASKFSTDLALFVVDCSNTEGIYQQINTGTNHTFDTCLRNAVRSL